MKKKINKDILIQRIDEICAKKNINRTTAFTESGVGKNFKSNLAKCDPSEGKITMLANYFGVSVDYLIGNSDTSEPLSGSAKPSPFLVTPENEKESRVLFAYRSHPEMQPAVDKLLGITDDGNVTLYTAAKSAENHKPEITQMPKDKWDTITTTPETEEDLL